MILSYFCSFPLFSCLQLLENSHLPLPSPKYNRQWHVLFSTWTVVLESCSITSPAWHIPSIFFCYTLLYRDLWLRSLKITFPTVFFNAFARGVLYWVNGSPSIFPFNLAFLPCLKFPTLWWAIHFSLQKNDWTFFLTLDRIFLSYTLYNLIISVSDQNRNFKVLVWMF